MFPCRLLYVLPSAMASRPHVIFAMRPDYASLETLLSVHMSEGYKPSLLIRSTFKRYVSNPVFIEGFPEPLDEYGLRRLYTLVVRRLAPLR